MGGFNQYWVAKIFFLLIMVCSFAFAVTTTTSSVFSDYSPEDSDDFVGSCTGTESGSNDLFYEYKLYQNDTLFFEGFTPMTTTTPDPYYTGHTGSWQNLANAFDNNTGTYSSVQYHIWRYLMANYTNTGDDVAYVQALYSFFGNDGMIIRFQCYNSSVYVNMFEDNYHATTQNNSILIPRECNDGVGDIAVRVAYRTNSGTGQFQLRELDVDFHDPTKYSSGSQTDVVTVSNSDTNVGDEWVLSCKAQYDTEEGSFLNSSVATVVVDCVSNWTCVGYGACVNNSQDCDSVADTNFCGDLYTGNYSEFSPQYCFGYQHEYSSDDISPVVVDFIFAFLKGFVALAGLIALFFLFKKAKVWVKEK